MKAHYKLFLSLAIGSFVTFAGCQDDEVVDLVKYPVNQPAITINDAEGASKATLTAVYKSDGTLELNGPVTRTYTFHFAASPEDATVTFDVINTNIPKENVEISDTKVVLPAGSTDASVTVTLKDEDFSFAASNYDAATYELGVKASVEGYKIGTESIESKIVIEKEAYIASCSVVGENGNTVSFERAFSQGAIVNTDPISYAFKMKLDKPARKDVKVKLATTGLDEKFMNKITVTPAEITIPAGELESAEITWSITDDFLLTTTEAEFHTLVVAASVDGIPKESCLFMIACLQTIVGKYSYSNGLFPNLLKRETIKLPIDGYGKPDWNYMKTSMLSIKESISSSPIFTLKGTIKYFV